MNILVKYTAIYHPQANPSERPHSGLNKVKDILDRQGIKLDKTDIIRFSWSNNLCPKRSTGKAPVQILYGSYPLGISDDVIQEQLTTHENNPVCENVIQMLNTKAMNGMLNSQNKTPENLENGTKLTWRVKTRAGKLTREAVVITCNQTSVFVRFQDSVSPPRWVSRKDVEHSIPILGCRAKQPEQAAPQEGGQP